MLKMLDHLESIKRPKSRPGKFSRRISGAMTANQIAEILIQASFNLRLELIGS